MSGAVALINTKGMSRDEWLKARMNGIGGSDAAVVAGLSKYKSPVGLWLEKTGQVEPEEVGEAAYWGTVLEDVVAKEFERQTGLKVRRRNAILVHPKHEFMFANVDRLIVGQNIGLECKTASEYLKDRWTDDEVPDQYYLQCQHYMAVTGFKGWYIAVLIGGNKFQYKLIERDDEFIKTLIKIEAEFWQHVIDNTMPPVDGTDASTDALKMMYPASDGSEIALGTDAEAWIQAYELADRAEREAKSRKELAKNKLCEMLGQAERGKYGERLVCWSTASGRTSVDNKALKSKFPEIYQQVVKTEAQTRRFSLK